MDLMDEPDVVVGRSGDTATITMNQPRRRNALSLRMLQSLCDAFAEVGDSSATGIVLAGAGPVFSAGHDFGEVGGAGHDAVRRLLQTCTRLMELMQAVPQPV